MCKPGTAAAAALLQWASVYVWRAATLLITCHLYGLDLDETGVVMRVTCLLDVCTRAFSATDVVAMGLPVVAGTACAAAMERAASYDLRPLHRVYAALAACISAGAMTRASASDAFSVRKAWLLLLHLLSVLFAGTAWHLPASGVVTMLANATGSCASCVLVPLSRSSRTDVRCAGAAWLFAVLAASAWARTLSGPSAVPRV